MIWGLEEFHEKSNKSGQVRIRTALWWGGPDFFVVLYKSCDTMLKEVKCKKLIATFQDDGLILEGPKKLNFTARMIQWKKKMRLNS